MSGSIQYNQANEISEVTEDTPSTSTKKSNENDNQMKSKQITFKEKDQIASEKLRYDNADLIYPE